MNQSAKNMLLPSPLDELHEAVTHYLREAGRAQRSRDVAPVLKKLETKMRSAFRAQGKDFRKRFKALKDSWPVLSEASEPGGPDWEPLFDVSAQGTIQLFRVPIDEAVEAALVAGGAQALGSLKAGISFDLANPRAIRYLQDHGAEMVTKINETTRSRIQTIITRAAKEGWSYDKTARAISNRYAEFAVGQPQLHIESRAHLVAVTETGNAYCEGNLEAGRQMADAGLEMEKYWITAGDDRVDDTCAANEAQGWIPIDETFDSGNDRPLAHPACRCDLEIRVVTESRTIQPTGGQAA